MLKRALVLFTAASIAIMTLHAAGQDPGTRTRTVGGFVQKLAVAMGQDGGDVKAATRALERLGMAPIGDLQAPLTDRMVARIAADLGIGITLPDRPETPVSAARAGAMASLLGKRFVEEQSAEAEDVIEPPTECIQSRTRGECVECCIEAVGPLPDPGGGTRDPGSECAKFCQNNIEPPPSEFEPQP